MAKCLLSDRVSRAHNSNQALSQGEEWFVTGDREFLIRQYAVPENFVESTLWEGDAVIVVGNERKKPVGFSIAALHLLWTVPVALLIGYPLWFAARLGWCGFGGCWGSTADSQQLGYALGVVLAVACPGLVFAAVAVPPWVRPWWIRWVVALLLALIDAYVFGWGNSPSPLPFLPTIGNGGISLSLPGLHLNAGVKQPGSS